MLLWDKAERKQKFIITLLIVVSAISSVFGTTFEEISEFRGGQNAVVLTSSLVDEDIILVDEGVSDHVFYTVALYCENDVYYLGEDVEKSVFHDVFPNTTVAASNESTLYDLVSSGKTVYFATSKTHFEEEVSDYDVSCTLLGKYKFDAYVYFYKITGNSGQANFDSGGA